jgi:transketolase
MRQQFVESLVNAAAKDERILLLTGDLGYQALDPFVTAFPQRFVNAGVAEQNMIGVASGLAKQGFVVFVYSIANFPTLRALEQIRNDAAYHDLSVKLVSAGVGFAYPTSGFSHMATEDVASLRGISGVRIFSPADEQDIQESTLSMIANSGVDYLRLGRTTVGLPRTLTDFEIGRWRASSHQAPVCLLATGQVLEEVVLAAESLSVKGINTRIVDCNQLSNLHDQMIVACIEPSRLIVCVEEHSTSGGLGDLVAAAVGRSQYRAKLICLGMSDTRVKFGGSASYLRQHYGLDSSSIARVVAQEVST